MYGDGGAWFTAPITSGYVQRGGYGAARSGSRTSASVGFDVARTVQHLNAQVSALTRAAEAAGFDVTTFKVDQSLSPSRQIAALNARAAYLKDVLAQGSAASERSGRTGQTAADFVASQFDVVDNAKPANLSVAPPTPWVPVVVGLTTVAAIATATYIFLRSRS